MPKSTLLEMPPEEQAQMLAALRRAVRYLLALHILLWCAVGRNPTAIADVLFCSRSRVVPHHARISGRPPGPGARRGRSARPPSARPCWCRPCGGRSWRC